MSNSTKLDYGLKQEKEGVTPFLGGPVSLFQAAPLLWSIFIGLVLTVVVKKFLLFRKMPPGPYGLPFVGCLFHFKNTLAQLQTYKKKYGDIFSFSCGDFYVIVINGHKAIQEASKRPDLSGRPDFYVWTSRNFGDRNRGILISDIGDTWQEQRRFAMRSLRDFGLGRQSMEGLIVHEMEELVKNLRGEVGKPMNLAGIYNGSVLNSLWTVVTGKRFDLDDPEFKEILSLFLTSMRFITITYAGLFWPWPAVYGLLGRQNWKTSMDMRVKLRAMMSKHINYHLETYDPSVTRDFIDLYLHEINRGDETHGSFLGEEGDLNLRVTLLDLFTAGVETTATTLNWASLFLSQCPQVQAKLQEEIDRVVGDRNPSRDDKVRMVYMEAFLNEVHRMSSILPMSVYHRAMKDTEFAGYFLPRGSILFLNLHDAHHDPAVWGDPEVFRPERFLNKDETQIVKNEALIAFGAGKRQCLGELLARDSLFIFVTDLVRNYSFKSEGKLNMEGTPTFVSSPQQFEVILEERKF